MVFFLFEAVSCMASGDGLEDELCENTTIAAALLSFFLVMLHLEGKAFEEMKRRRAEQQQYADGGGVFFVSSDLKKRRKSFEAPSSSGALVQYRQSADVDKQPYGPWGRHPELRYPYADPAEPGSGNIGIYANGKEETASGNKMDDGFQWGSSFEKGRKMPVKRVQQTWHARKAPPGKGQLLPDLPKSSGKAQVNEDPFMGMAGRGGGKAGGSAGGGSRTTTPGVKGWESRSRSRPGSEDRSQSSGGLWGGLDGNVQASGEVVHTTLRPIKGGAFSLRG